MTPADIGYWVGGLAAGVTGATYLTRKGWRGFKLLARAAKAVARLAAIGDEASWPNGSHDLPTFLDRVYGWLGSIDEKLVAHLQSHQAAEIDQARGAREWDERDAASI